MTIDVKSQDILIFAAYGHEGSFDFDILVLSVFCDVL